MRTRPLAYAGLLAGGALAVVGSAQPWWRAVGEGIAVRFTGTEVTGGLSQALAVVVLAGTLLSLALRARGRRVLGALLALAGVGLVAVGLVRARPSVEAVRTQVRTVSLADQFALVGTLWPALYLSAGVLVLVGAVTMALSAPRWASRADRYRRDVEPARSVAADDDPAEVWKAMDAGLDPTLVSPADTSTTPPGPPTHPAPPDVRNGGSGDTMGSSRPGPSS